MHKQNDINKETMQRVSEKLAAKNGKPVDDGFSKAVKWYSENLISKGIEQGFMPAERKQELVDATIKSFKIICSGTNNNAHEHIQKSYAEYINNMKSATR